MEKQIVSFRIDKELHTRLKVRAAKEGRTMVTILEEVLKIYLDEKEGGDKGSGEE